MSTASLWVVYPSSEVSNSAGFTGLTRGGNQVHDSLRSSGCCKNLMFNGGLTKGPKNRMDSSYRKACSRRSRLTNGSSVCVMSNVVAEPAGEIGLSSEQKVYDVVVKQAALVKRELKSSSDTNMKRGIILPGSVSVLGEAYDRCRQVCAEYAKTFYLGLNPLPLSLCSCTARMFDYLNWGIDKLYMVVVIGTMLMTPERRRAIWAIYVWCRRTDELVDGPNASHITATALDRWEARLEDIFGGRPFDMLDAALSHTVSMFPVDIQPFRDMIEGMRMDLNKSRYNNFDELYLYCYYVAGSVGLVSVPVMGIAPESKATTESVYAAALALGLANQLTNILRDVGEE
ncbi:hypothetical protein ACS0TY_029036 [Phlomoides rotata]